MCIFILWKRVLCTSATSRHKNVSTNVTTNCRYKILQQIRYNKLHSSFYFIFIMVHCVNAVADLHSKILDPTPRIQILSVSFSFWENLSKSYAGTTPPPPPGELASPSRENPGSATEMYMKCYYLSLVKVVTLLLFL